MHVTFAGTSNVYLKKSNSHTHPVWEIIVNTEGEGTMEIGDKSYSFGPGTVCCIPPGVKHNKSSDGGFKDIYFSVQTEALKKDKEYFLLDDEDKNIETLVYMIIKTFHKKGNNYIATADSLADAVCNMISGKLSGPKEINREIETFVNELILNYSDCDFTASKVMNLTNYNRDHFRRLFKRYTGKTPVEYLTLLRIRNAKNMLVNNSQKSIKMISLESGFSDYFYFAKVFKKHTGMTPGEYASSKKQEQ